MSINANNNKNAPVDTDACYEEVASQEELYLEKTEEEVVAILNFSYVSPASQSDCSTLVDICAERKSDLEIERVTTDLTSPPMVGNPDEQLVETAEELITGDLDDPPFSEGSIQEMLNDSPARGSDQ